MHFFKKNVIIVVHKDLKINLEKCLPVGYQVLAQHFLIDKTPPFFSSFLNATIKRKITIKKTALKAYVFPLNYLLKDLNDYLFHLYFAIKYEGLNFEILRKILPKIPKIEIERLLKEFKFDVESRKIWYLYELITKSLCNIPNISSGDYEELLDSTKLYTAKPKKSTRHRILDNLLGTIDFCPIVKKSRKLKHYETVDFCTEAHNLLKRHGPQLPVEPNFPKINTPKMKEAKLRYKKLVRLIKSRKPPLKITKEKLISIHNQLVSSGFYEEEFRKHQNYLAFGNGKKITRISPQAKDVPILLDGLLNCYERMIKSSVHPVIIASVISFGFSIIHPFGDANGRVHLYLFYSILFNSKFKDCAQIFCRSLTNFFYLPGFNESVALFDRSLKDRISYTLHKNATLTVHGKTIDYYRYIDFTKMAEFCFSAIEWNSEKLKEVY